MKKYICWSILIATIMWVACVELSIKKDVDLQQNQFVSNVNFYQTQTVAFEVPDIDSSFKSYMDFRTITCSVSKQYGMQQTAYTNVDGLRIFNGRIMIALGTYYSAECGECFDITLENGNVLKCVIGDIKADIHTNDSNQYIEHNNNVVEFIVDVNKISDKARVCGDMSYIQGFDGKIKSIEKVVG